jgi:serine-type D-Ala-D-Ala carboxypeptidase/endopeptidase (penicillin-binding protein 4)
METRTTRDSNSLNFESPAAGIIKGKLPSITVRMARYFFLVIFLIVILAACTSPKHLGRTRLPGNFLDNPVISGSHAGIAIYDLQTRRYVYQYNGDKYFVPASNTKLATLYAGLKYLGDGIPGIEYLDHNDTIFIRATGDPTFLLTDFEDQPVLSFLQYTAKPVVIVEPAWETNALGFGWPWNFYLNYYMAERSPFPIYGNLINWAQKDMPDLAEGVQISYITSSPRHTWPVEIRGGVNEKLKVARPVTENSYVVFPGLDGDRDIFVPFATNGMEAAIELLRDTLHRDFLIGPAVFSDQGHLHSVASRTGVPGRFQTVFSRPADSLFRPMMMYSDNFFAEQTLMMVSHRVTGVMNEEKLIQYLLETDLVKIPGKPRWVDGSGLSRYNLFSPRSFIWLLEKMTDEFGFERISRLLPTGGEGTLEDLYLAEKGRIFAKTGTLGGNSVALSGLLITENGRTLLFSVLVNNHNSDSMEVRAAIQDFLREIIYRH